MPQRPRRLRWLLAAAFLAALALALSYRHFTHPQRLAARAAAALRELGLPDVRIGHAAFSPGDGLALENVTSATLNTGTRPFHLRIGLARIRLSLAALLFGQFHPTWVELDGVTIAVLLDPAAPRAAEPAPGPDFGARLAQLLHERSLPPLSLKSADLQLQVRDRSGSRLILRHLVSGAGQPGADTYDLRLDRMPALPTPLAVVRWAPRRNTIECVAAGTQLDIDAFVRLLPPDALAALRPLTLSGGWQAERVMFRLGGPAGGGFGETQLAAADLRVGSGELVVPVEAAPAPGAGERAEPYLRLRDVAGTLHYERPDPAQPGEFGGELTADLRGAAVRLALRADAGPLNGWLFGPRAAGVAPTLHEVRAAELEVRGLEFPTPQTWPAFLESPHLRGPLGSIFRDYAARGRMSAHVRVLPDTGHGEPTARLEAVLEPEGMSCRYRHFPLPFDDVRGTVRIAGGRVFLDDVRGRHGSGEVHVSGELENTQHWTGFDLTFRGTAVPLDGDLYAALPADYQRLWGQAAPLGLCDITTRVQRPNGSAQTGVLPATVSVAAHLLSGSLNIGPQQRIDHADGWLQVEDGRVWARQLRGFDGQTAILLDGLLHGTDDAETADVRVELHGLAVTQEARLDPAATQPALRFAGRADACGRVWSRDKQRGQHLLVRLRGGELRGSDPERAWTVTDGLVEVQDSLSRIRSFTATQEAARLLLAGTLPPGGSGVCPTLELHASTPLLEQLYPQFLPADWTASVRAIEPAGAGDVRVQLSPDPRDPSRPAVAVECTAASVRPRALPMDLRDVTARFALWSHGFQVHEAVARCGTDGRITVRQAAPGAWEGPSVAAEFDVAAERMEFSPGVVGALPAAVARALERIALRGGFDLRSHVRIGGDGGRTWELAGEVVLRDAALRLGLDAQIAAGALRGSLRVGTEHDVDLDSVLTVERGTIAGRVLEELRGRLRMAPGDAWVRLADVYGRVCGGVVQAQLALDPVSTDYELTVNVDDVAAAELLPRGAAAEGSPRPGRIDAELWLRGRGDDVGTRRGGGRLRVRGGSLVQLPIVEWVVRLAPPVSDAVDTATMRFLWEGRTLRLERVDIRGRDLRLVGEGSWSLRDDRIEMTLYAAHPDDWPRLGVLSELVESAGRALVQYRVDGTLDEPRVRAEPLHSLSEPVRRLLAGD